MDKSTNNSAVNYVPVIFTLCLVIALAVAGYNKLKRQAEDRLTIAGKRILSKWIDDPRGAVNLATLDKDTLRDVTMYAVQEAANCHDMEMDK